MKSKLHAALGGLALLCIASFWTSTLVSELLLGHESVTAVKNAVLSAMWLFIPAMAATCASGFSLARKRGGRLVDVKKRRTQVAAANGVLVLLPSAIFLASKANAGSFDATFYAVQMLELAAGALNFIMLALNMRDGLRLSGRLAPKRVGARKG